MPRSFPLIAVGIGAVITLNPVGVTHSQTLTASDSTLEEQEAANASSAPLVEQKALPKTDGDSDSTRSNALETDSLAHQVAFSSPTETKPSSDSLGESNHPIDSKVDLKPEDAPVELSSAKPSNIVVLDISPDELIELEIEPVVASGADSVDHSVASSTTGTTVTAASRQDSALVMAQRESPDLNEIRALFDTEAVGSGDVAPIAVEREFAAANDGRSGEHSLQLLAQREILDLDQIRAIFDTEAADSIEDSFTGVEREVDYSTDRRSAQNSLRRLEQRETLDLDDIQVIFDADANIESSIPLVEREVVYFNNRQPVESNDRQLAYADDHQFDDVDASQLLEPTDRQFDYADDRRSIEHSTFMMAQRDNRDNPDLDDIRSIFDDGGSRSSSPTYLDPDPNPLRFPTRPQEVEIVGTQPITLTQALELARRNNRELQIAELDLARRQAELREVRAQLYPTLDATSSFTAQQGIENQSTQLDPVTGELISTQQDNAVDFIASANLQVDYALFTSGRRPALIRAAEGQVRSQELQLEALVEQLRFDVTDEYYDLQESDENVRIAGTTVEQAEQSLRDAQALENAGVGTRFDVLQAEVDLANFRQELTQAISNREIARRQLARRLSIAESVDIATADPVEVADSWELSLEESIVLAYRNRAELEQQLVQRYIGQQQRRAARSEVLPQVSLVAGYGVQDTIDENDEVSDNFSIGAQLQWRLFDGGASSASADQSEIDVAIAEERFADTRNQVRFEVEQSYLNLQSNFENIQTATLAVGQANEALRLARLRFGAGVGTQTDVLISQTDLAEAELNLVRAIIGYNRSLVSLRRSVSNYPGSVLTDIR